jgi:hypothetical protein
MELKPRNAIKINYVKDLLPFLEEPLIICNLEYPTVMPEQCVAFGCFSDLIYSNEGHVKNGKIIGFETRANIPFFIEFWMYFADPMSAVIFHSIAGVYIRLPTEHELEYFLSIQNQLNPQAYAKKIASKNKLI